MCVVPSSQSNVLGVVMATPSTLTYPEPAGFDVIVIVLAGGSAGSPVSAIIATAATAMIAIMPIIM